MTEPPFAVVLETAYGKMIVHRLDGPQSLPLFTTSKAVGHDEVMLLIETLNRCPRDGRVVIDVGANFGVFSLSLARYASKVIAFEPQRVIYYMLAGSVALNGMTNVHCINAAVGDRLGWLAVPQFDYREPLSFGSVEFGQKQLEPLAQLRHFDPDAEETVPLTMIDTLSLKRLDLLKIDAEGMELEVLRGAAATIERCKPILYVEWLKVGVHILRERLQALGYTIYDSPGCNFLALPI